MPNKITYTAVATNTTKAIEYWNPYTQQYQDTNPLTGIPAGSYAGLKARLKGSNPAIIATYVGSVTVTDGATQPTQLTAPTGLAVTAMSSSIGSSWNQVSNATGYRLQRAAVSNSGVVGAYSAVYEGAATSYADSDVAPGATYAYRVLTLGTGSYSNSPYSAPKQGMATPPVSGWDGRPGYTGPFGDSRVANEGFEAATGPDFAWPKVQDDNMNTGAGAGHYKFENLGQPSKGTDELLVAVDAYVKQRYDLVKYWRQVMPVLVGVNDRLHHPEWDVSVSIENLRQIHLKLHAAGLPTIAMTEPHSYAFTQYPAWFRAYNDAIKAMAVSQWGCESVVDLENVASISNMLDTTISPDNLHFTTKGNQLLEAAITPYVNAYFAGQGMPTSTSGGGSDKVTPNPPTVTQSGRTITAAAGNGLDASTLRYQRGNGTAQVGASYTVPDSDSVAAGEVQFYSVATGNYNQSAPAGNPASIAAVAVGYVINADFSAAKTQNIQTGWLTATDYGDNQEKIYVTGDGFARFADTRPYGTLSGKFVLPGPGNYKVVAIVKDLNTKFYISDSTYAQRWDATLQEVNVGNLPSNSRVEIPFTVAQGDPLEGVLRGKTEDASTFALDYFNIENA